MKTEVPTNITRVIILDISGIYTQIHNEGYFPTETVHTIKNQYKDPLHWKVLILQF